MTRLFEKPTTIRINTQPGRAISGAVLFAHLRAVLEGYDLTGDSVLVIRGDGSVTLDGETVYTPRRIMQNSAKNRERTP